MTAQKCYVCGDMILDGWLVKATGWLLCKYCFDGKHDIRMKSDCERWRAW